jgi:hypothetical protein
LLNRLGEVGRLFFGAASPVAELSCSVPAEASLARLWWLR